MEKKPDIFEWQLQRRLKHLKGQGIFAFKKSMLYHGHKLSEIVAYHARDGQFLMGGKCASCERDIEAKMLYDQYRPNPIDFFILIESPFFRQSFFIKDVEEKKIFKEKITDGLVCPKFRSLL